MARRNEDLSQRISEEAERLHTFDRMAELLASNLNHVMPGFTVTVYANFEALVLDVEATCRLSSKHGEKAKLSLSVEEIWAATDSASGYMDYLRELAEQIRADIGVPEIVGWYETTDGRILHGQVRSSWRPARPAAEVREEMEAIASIRRTLAARQSRSPTTGSR